jgi:alpha-beta hydrolase superfamily lysophospholipase
MILHDSAKNDIHIYLYEPAEKPYKGIVHIIHGASEHLARYGLFAEFLNQNGYAVIGSDLLGHGLSTPTNDYVHFADKNGADLAFESVTLVMDLIKKTFPDLPVFLLGHSMGSFLARLVLLRYPNFYQKAVLSGTAYMAKPLMAAAGLLSGIIRLFRGPRAISPLMNKMGMEAFFPKMVKDGLVDKNGLVEQWLTKNVEIQKYYHDSPMCGQPFTVSAYGDLMSWLKVINNLNNIKKGNKETPLFFFSGAVDPVSNYGKEVRQLADDFMRVGYKSVVLKLYPNDRHEVLNELDNRTAYQDVLDFFNK